MCIRDRYSFDESGMHKEEIHSNNMIIHGDNLEALKSLLPQYEGKIKCIYICLLYTSLSPNILAVLIRVVVLPAPGLDIRLTINVFSSLSLALVLAAI